MSDITFAQLLEIYRNVCFNEIGDKGVLRIATPEILDTLRIINNNNRAADDSGIGLPSDPISLKVNDSVEISVTPPRVALGYLKRSVGELLLIRQALIEEPKAYYIIEDGFFRESDEIPPAIQAYRKVLEIYKLLAEAAAYADPQKQELVFIHEGKFLLPVRYGEDLFARLKIAEANRFLEMLANELHREEKLSLLGNAVVNLTKSTDPKARFSYLINNIDAVADEVAKGYRLYVSQFSYTKIKSDVEAARVDFVTKIHKTIIDIQTQLLGIPIATFIVASQFKVAKACGLTLWSNVAVLVGAWIFIVLLFIAIINQWMTLASIRWEIERQRKKLETDFEIISQDFLGIFRELRRRICWHRGVLVVISVIALGGAILASVVYVNLTTIRTFDCVLGKPLTGTSAQPAVEPKAPKTSSKIPQSMRSLGSNGTDVN